MPEQVNYAFTTSIPSITIHRNVKRGRGYRLRDAYLRRLRTRQLRIFMTELLEAGRLNQYRLR